MRKYKNVLKVIIVVLITLMCFSKISYVYGTVDLDDIKVSLDEDEEDNQNRTTGSGNSGGIGIRPATPSTTKKPNSSSNLNMPNNGKEPVRKEDIQVPLDSDNEDNQSGSESNRTENETGNEPVRKEDIQVPLDENNQNSGTGSGNSGGIGIRPTTPSTIKKPNGQTNMPTGSNIPDPITNPDYYQPGNIEGADLFMEKANTIISGIRLVGTLIAVIAVIGMGIKYMLASASERAQYKETMIPYIIGAIMLFTISNVLGIIYDLVKEIQI